MWQAAAHVLLTTMITVRDSRPDDAEAVRRVEASATATLRETYHPNQKALSHRKAISRSLRRLVAESDDTVVGTTQYCVDGNAIHVIGLGVRSDSRRQGVARALLAEVAARARRHGLSAVVTRTVEPTGNVPIFEAVGFTATSRCRDEYSGSVKGGELTDVSLEMRISDDIVDGHTKPTPRPNGSRAESGGG